MDVLCLSVHVSRNLLRSPREKDSSSCQCIFTLISPLRKMWSFVWTNLNPYIPPPPPPKIFSLPCLVDIWPNGSGKVVMVNAYTHIDRCLVKLTWAFIWDKLKVLCSITSMRLNADTGSVVATYSNLFVTQLEFQDLFKSLHGKIIPLHFTSCDFCNSYNYCLIKLISIFQLFILYI